MTDHRNFTQMITFECADPDTLVEMCRQWDLQQATLDPMGYMSTRVLQDRESLGRYVMVVEFGVVDPGVSAADEATRNNRREETRAFAAKLREIVEGLPSYHHYDELYRTDF